MLAIAIGGVWFYSVRKTAQLFDLGVNAHIQCAVAADINRRLPHSDLADAFGAQLAAAGKQELVAAGTCSAAGRDYTEIVLREQKALISVAITHRGDQDIFPRALAGRVENGIHLADRSGYSVAAFDAGPYLAFVVSNLPDDRNEQLAQRFAPILSRSVPQ
jgi:hypothetical protein